MIEKMKCFYNKEGELINIGEWDYMEYPVFDDEGLLIETRQGNTPPAGFYIKQQNVSINTDGSRTVISE